MHILQLDSDVLELAEPTSISYHDPDFFLEVLPRRYSLTLLLPLDFSEIDDPSGLAQDATRWSFLYTQVTKAESRCVLAIALTFRVRWLLFAKLMPLPASRESTSGIIRSRHDRRDNASRKVKPGRRRPSPPST